MKDNERKAYKHNIFPIKHTIQILQDTCADGMQDNREKEYFLSKEQSMLLDDILEKCEQFNMVHFII